MFSDFSRYQYQVGGSLPLDAPSYVKRQADETLYQALLNRKFCYVFNSRQMGKSSLRVRTMHRLMAANVRCAVVDMTAIGIHQITPEQWYASIVGLLCNSFKLPLNAGYWWRAHAHLSLTVRLSEFLRTVLLPQFPQDLVIFIDEIDSVLNLQFPVDDFFAMIRACYNQRAEQPEFQRLSFALIGVTTPADLIRDRTRTPFNVGQAIELQGFKFCEVESLLPILAQVSPCPYLLLSRILYWTNGQPFLTQKLCHLVVQTLPPTVLIAEASAPTLVDRLVQTHLIENWESQDEPEHLRTIRNRLLADEQQARRLLERYQQVLIGETKEEQEPIAPESLPSVDHTLEQVELLLAGIVEKTDGRLRLKNPLYRAVFNLAWVEQQLQQHVLTRNN